MSHNWEESALEKVDRMLIGTRAVALQVDGEGESVELPDTVRQMLRQIVAYIMQGRTVFIVPAAPMLTAAEAAKFLNMPREKLLELLEHGTIPFLQVRAQKRVMISDLLAYQKRQQAECSSPPSQKDDA